MVKPRIEDKLIKHDEELVALDEGSSKLHPNILYQRVVEDYHFDQWNENSRVQVEG